MKKLLTTMTIALLLAALLCPFALAEEEIAPEAVDAPVEALEGVALDGAEEVYEAQEAEIAQEGDADEIPIDEAHFPDAGFRAYVAQFDTDGNGSFSGLERALVYSIKLTEPVSSLNGIEYFKNLDSLTCSSVGLASLDVSQNKELSYLNCSGNGLSAIDVSQNSNLKDLACYENNLSTLDISHNQKLESLLCGRNALTTLDISQNTNLKSLGCELNSLTSLDTSNNPNLQNLSCNNNNLASLDVSHNTELFYIGCMYNDITELNVSGLSKLSMLSCYHTALTSLDVSNLQSLKLLHCEENCLTTLNAANCTKLEELHCENNQLTSLIIDNCVSLVKVDSHNNKLSTLDISTCTALAAIVDVNVDKPLVEGAVVIYGSMQGNYLYCENNIKITGGNPLPPRTASRTYNVTKAKSSYSPTLGKTYQINPGGATGTGYKSSKKSVATVSDTGVITPQAAGKAKITFWVGKKKYIMSLTVKDPTIPTSISLNLSGTVEAKVGEQQTLTASLNEGAVSGIKWKSSKKKIATVDANGVVTFKKAGKVKITATTTRGKIKASVTFKVTK